MEATHENYYDDDLFLNSLDMETASLNKRASHNRETTSSMKQCKCIPQCNSRDFPTLCPAYVL